MLYTVVMEYRGGTYISQVESCTVIAALQDWAFALDSAPIQGLGHPQKDELIKAIDSDLSYGLEPSPLDGLVNAWCASASTSGGSVLINLIGTASQDEFRRPTAVQR